MLTIHSVHSGLSEQERLSYGRQLAEELAALQQAAKGFYEEEHASINLPVDPEHPRMVKRLAAKYKGVSLIVVVGIGGSNLGTMAVQEAVLGRLHNLSPGKRPRILYADTVDPDSISTINAIMEAELKAKRNVLLSAVSKSGGTTETTANFEVLLQTLQKHKKAKAKEYVVITTDQDSHFWNLAKQEGFAVLPMPHKVGGRYSVLSPVGLFPLAVLGIDIDKLLGGAAHMRQQCLRPNNPAMLRAAMLANALSKGRTIADNFYFKTDFESVGKWYRQLMGESVGKEWDRGHTKQVHMGMTPTVSIGSTDLHSMAQLYFGGPNDKFFTLVTVRRSAAKPTVPKMPQYEALVPNIQGKQLSVIMEAIVGGVQATLIKDQRDFCIIELPDTSEQSIGALLQLHMMEMMYLAAILGVNPFDQPNVEEYKIETKRILARKRP